MRHIMQSSSDQASNVERGTVKWTGGRRFLKGGHITIPFAIRTTPDQKTCPKGPFHKCSVPTDRFSRTLPHDERPSNGN